MKFVALDWGTSNRRAYVVVDGNVEETREDDLGILKVSAGSFPEASATFLAGLEGLPVIMAGMVGSDRGWIGVPYCPAPAGIGDITDAVRWIDFGKLAIVPGVSLRRGDRADVMRGEESQVLGALIDGTLPDSSIVCLPGTHNKWVKVEGSRIVDFRTVMTGEAFALFQRYSILSDLMDSAAPFVASAFESGVRHGLRHNDLLSELFAVRARSLLGEKNVDAPSYISGLLCGHDIGAGLSDWPDVAEVYVIGRPSLTALTAAGLRLADRKAIKINGQDALVAGLFALARQLL